MTSGDERNDVEDVRSNSIKRSVTSHQAMAPVRVRHSGGVDTIEIALDDDAVSVQALQQQIYAVSGILPSRQQRAFAIRP